MSRRSKFTPAEDRDLLDFVEKKQVQVPARGPKALAAGGGSACNIPQLAVHEIPMAAVDPRTKDEDDHDKQDEDCRLSTTPLTTTTALHTDDNAQTDED